MDQGSNVSLEHTPTWAVSVVFLFFGLLSLIIDSCLHYLMKFLRKRKRKSLLRALEKVKKEMMTMGFISLLLTILEGPISKICIPKNAAESFLPCKDTMESPFQPATPSAAQLVPASKSNTTVSTDDNYGDQAYCEAKGMVSLMSSAGVRQLKIFISVLAVFHVFNCLLTMCLGMAKMRRWKAWEEETKSLQYQIANDPERFRLAHQTSFGRRHLKIWSNPRLLLWPVCFIRQFYGSVSKADYLTLRNGFIMANVAEGSTFDFQKFLSRAFDGDFEQVVEIRFWIWMFSILFIFFEAHGFYSYYWLPFIPLVLVLAVGTKLEIIIAKMCVEGCKDNSVVRGPFRVKLSDELFWFNRPNWLLHLLQLILLQNSFQLAFFVWTWYEYGLRSCFNKEKEDIAIRIPMGIGVQLLCGYVTLPVYALVTQMGSGMKPAIFTERVTKGLKNWHQKARHRLSRSRSTSLKQTTNSNLSDAAKSSVSGLLVNRNPEENHSNVASLAIMSPPTPNTTKDAKHNNSASSSAITSISTPGIIGQEDWKLATSTAGSYDGEISFASSWKNMESSIESHDISSIIEEDSSDLLVADLDNHDNHNL